MAAPRKNTKSGNLCEEIYDLTRPISDPYAVLLGDNVKVPVQNVEPLESMEEFDKQSKVNLFDSLRPDEKVAIEKSKQCALEKDEKEAEGLTFRKKRELGNVLKRMFDTNQEDTGPRDLLRRALTQKIRVKVWTRNHTQVRSILTGFIKAFDRHMNLAMADVDEVIMRCTDVNTPILRPINPDEFPGNVSNISSEADLLGTGESTDEDIAKPLLMPTHSSLKRHKLKKSPVKITLKQAALTGAENEILLEEARKPESVENTVAPLQNTKQFRIPKLSTQIAEVASEAVFLSPETTVESSDAVLENTDLTKTESTLRQLRIREKKKQRRCDEKKRVFEENMVTLERHIGQLFIRGDNVVMVALLDT